MPKFLNEPAISAKEKGSTPDKKAAVAKSDDRPSGPSKQEPMRFRKETYDRLRGIRDDGQTTPRRGW